MWALNSTYIHQALAVPYPLRREAHCTGCVASEIACRDIPTGPRQGACTYVTEEPRSYLFSPRTATGWPDSQRDQHCLQLGTTLWIPYMCLRSSLDQTPGRNDDWCFRGGGVNKVGVKCVYLRPQITVIRDSRVLLRSGVIGSSLLGCTQSPTRRRRGTTFRMQHVATPTTPLSNPSIAPLPSRAPGEQWRKYSCKSHTPVNTFSTSTDAAIDSVEVNLEPRSSRR